MAAAGVQQARHWMEGCAQAPSSHTHSCIKLGCHTEPCVNKAVSHLNTLKQRLSEEEKKRNREKEAGSVTPQRRASYLGVRGTESTPKPLTVTGVGTTGSELGNVGKATMPAHGPKSSVLFRRSDLFVEGVGTGTVGERVLERGGGLALSPVEEQPWLDAEAVVHGALELVRRLDGDRQEALESLVSERERVAQLRRALDVERERRMDLLPSVVQAEHEQCLKDVLELKLHVSYEDRQLGRARDALRVTSEKNEKLQRKVGFFTDNCPLLEEKLLMETDNMAQVARHQEETSDQLHKAKHKQAKTEDRSSQAHSRATAERMKMKQALSESREKVQMASEELAVATDKMSAISHKMVAANKSIAEHHQQSRLYDEKIGQCRVNQSTIKARTSYLQEDLARLEVEHEKISERNNQLRKKRDAEHASLASTQSVLLSNLRGEEDKLRETRDGNDEMEQEIDTLKETIAACIKQTGDDARSIERAKKELVRLDQQLQVSMAQFSKVREVNFRVTEQLRSEEIKTGDIEHSLKSTVDTLQRDLKEETKMKVTFQGKIKADAAHLVTLREQGRREEEEVRRMAEESQTQSQEQTDTVTKLEDSLKEKQSHHESLHSQLEAVRSEHSTVESSLRQRKDQLEPQEQELRVNVQKKVEVCDETSERISLLERRLEDVVKSSNMVEKMTRDTNAAIENLEQKLSVLRQRMEELREEEESWRQEFQEISDFSSDAEERHQNYLVERTELLKQHKEDLHSSLSANTALATGHRELQAKFIETKTVALRVLERKLDLETSLRDHKQLLAFQSRMYSTMQSYYEHRGLSSRRAVSDLSHHSKLNLQQLRYLQNQFDTVIRLMHDFLEYRLDASGEPGVTGQDTECGTGKTGFDRRRPKSGPQAKQKTVTFSVPLACES